MDLEPEDEKILTARKKKKKHKSKQKVGELRQYGAAATGVGFLVALAVVRRRWQAPGRSVQPLRQHEHQAPPMRGQL